MEVPVSCIYHPNVVSENILTFSH